MIHLNKDKKRQESCCMNLLFYPGLDSVDLERGYDEVKGATGKAIKDLSKHHKDIYLKVKFFFQATKGCS